MIEPHLAKQGVVAPKEAESRARVLGALSLPKHVRETMTASNDTREKRRPGAGLSPRGVLRAGWRMLGGAAALGRHAARAAGNPTNQPPNVPDWSRYLGDGVAVRAYGKPSKHEAHCHPPRRRMADRVARKLGQLHAAA